MHPDGFPLPRIESEVRPGASDRLGGQALAWIDERCPGEPLMPWQRYVVRRALETDAQGRLLWQRVVVMMARQQGKTYMMRRFLSWRLMGAQFGQAERILSTHADGEQATLLLEPWAREEMQVGKLDGGGLAFAWYPGGRVSTVEPTWIARASRGRGITGYSGLTTVYVDEVQSVPRQVVQKSLLPTMSGSRVRHPQAWFTGTGENDDSDLLRALRGAAADPRFPTLWLEWSSPPGCATDDEVAWRWASPDWSEGRADTLRLARAEMPEVEFRSEYLVQHDARVSHWLPERLWWAAREQGVVPAPGGVAAVEDRVGGGGFAAVSWMLPDGRVGVVAADFPRLSEAWSWADRFAPGVWLCGYSLRASVDATSRSAEKRGQQDTASALVGFRELVGAGQLVWDSEPLAVNTLRLRVSDHPDRSGLAVSPAAGVDSGPVRCAAWAVDAVQRLVGAALSA